MSKKAYEQAAQSIAANLRRIAAALEAKAAPAADGDYNAQDVAFALEMIDDNDGTIETVDAQALGGKNAELLALAGRVREARVAESEALTKWLADRGVAEGD